MLRWSLIYSVLLFVAILFFADGNRAEWELMPRPDSSSVSDYINAKTGSSYSLDLNGPSHNQVCVLAVLDPTIGVVALFGPDTTDPSDLTELLTRWRASFGGTQLVNWDTVGTSPEAWISFGNGSRIGLTQASIRIAIGSLLNIVRRAGYKPLSIAATPKYASVAGIGNARDQGGFRLLDLDRAKWEDYLGVGASAAPANVPLAVLWCLFLPLGFCVGYLLIASYVSREELPIGTRRKDYLRFGSMTLIGATTLHILSFWAIVDSGLLARVIGLWYGAGFPLLALLIVAGLAILIPLFLVARRIEWKLFGPDDGTPLSAPKKSRDEIAFRRKRAAIQIVILALGLVVLAIALSAWPDQSDPHLVGFAAFVFLVSLARSLPGKFVPGARKFFSGRPDVELSRRAQELAALMGVKPRTVAVLDGASASAHMSGRALPSGILVSQAATALRPEEMDFILSHELAHYKHNYLGRMQRLAVPFQVIFAGAMLYPILSGTTYPQALILPGFSILFVLWVVLMRTQTALARRMEFDADKIALEATRNTEAAISALTKIAASSQLPKLHDYDFNLHPSLPRRIAAMRARDVATESC